MEIDEKKFEGGDEKIGSMGFEAQSPQLIAQGPTVWDEKDDLGFFSLIWRTWTEVIFSPRVFFSRMPQSMGYLEPIVYAILMSIVGLILSIPGQMLFQSKISRQLGEMGDLGINIPFLLSPETTLMGFFVSALLIPIFVPVSFFILAGIIHLGVLILGGKGEFSATFRVIAYSSSVKIFNVFHVVPVLGSLFTFAYTIVLFAIGLREVHKFSTLRAIVVLAIPAIILFVFFLAVIFIVIILGRSFLDQFMNLDILKLI